MSSTTSRSDEKTAAPKPLLSNSSILILSGCLLGVVLIEVVPASFRFSVTMGGIVGVVAYVVLQSVARVREHKDRTHREEIVAMRLEGKVARHVLRSVPSRKRTPLRQSPTVSMRQYLPVADSSRVSKRPQR